MPKGHPIILSSETKQEIIDKYLMGISARCIAKEYNFKCQKSVIKIIRDNGIQTRSKKQASSLLSIQFTNQEISTIEQLNADPTIKLADISRILGYDSQTIKKELVRRNIYNPCKYEQHLIGIFDSIDTEEKAYWLGFLGADSNVNDKQLRLQLAEIDYDHICKFRDFMEIDTSIVKVYTKLNGKKFGAYCISIGYPEFVHSLKKHGLVPKKSLTLQFPTTIPDHLIKHYIRGMIDGDGSFSIRKKENALQFSLVSTLNICQNIQQHLIRFCDLNKTKLEEKIAKTGEKYYYLRYSGSQQCSRIAKYLYDDATIFLDRKKLLVDTFIANHKFHTVDYRKRNK